MNMTQDFGVWVAAVLTLFIFSFLYKDNPLYKFAEHLFVGVSAGYYIVLNYWTVIVANLYDPLTKAFTGVTQPPARRSSWRAEHSPPSRGTIAAGSSSRACSACCCSPA